MTYTNGNAAMAVIAMNFNICPSRCSCQDDHRYGGVSIPLNQDSLPHCNPLCMRGLEAPCSWSLDQAFEAMAETAGA